MLIPDHLESAPTCRKTQEALLAVAAHEDLRYLAAEPVCVALTSGYLIESAQTVAVLVQSPWGDEAFTDC